MNKYRNKKTQVDGITFDSKKEAIRYSQLKLLEKAGKIRNLKWQVKYPFVMNGKPIGISYIADFTYLENKEFVVEDVKGVKTQVYKIKKKLMRAFYNIDIKEV